MLKVFNKSDLRDGYAYWLINIETPVDKTGSTSIKLYNGCKRLSVKNYNKLKELINKHNLKLVPINLHTRNLLSAFKVDLKDLEIVFEYDL